VRAVDRLMRTDEVKDEFLGHARDVQRLYQAVMPDPIMPQLAPKAQVVRELEKAIRAQADPVDITAVLGEISDVLDGSIAAEPHIEPGAAAQVIDLSRVDFEVLEKKFAKSKTKNLEAQKLRALIERKLDNLIRLNASRYDYLDRFQKMIEPYNSGALSIEQLFEQLAELFEGSQRRGAAAPARKRGRRGIGGLRYFDASGSGSRAEGGGGDQDDLQGAAGEAEDRAAGAGLAEQANDAGGGAGGDREDAGCRVAGEIHRGAFRAEVRGALPARLGEVSGGRGECV
jgi:hypothetical protein